MVYISQRCFWLMILQVSIKRIYEIYLQMSVCNLRRQKLRVFLIFKPL